VLGFFVDFFSEFIGKNKKNPTAIYFLRIYKVSGLNPRDSSVLMRKEFYTILVGHLHVAITCKVDLNSILIMFLLLSFNIDAIDGEVCTILLNNTSPEISICITVPTFLYKV